MNKKELQEQMPRLGQHFLKMLKKHGLYGKFLKQRQENYSNFKDMMDAVLKKAHHDMGQRGLNGDDAYQYIMGVLNTMLHMFVENGLGIHPEKIGKMGQEVFEDFCIELFGEKKFKEYEDKQPKFPPINEDLMEKLHHLFETEGNKQFMDFDEFVKHILFQGRPVKRKKREEELYYRGVEENTILPF
jgi:hypothetical protein